MFMQKNLTTQEKFWTSSFGAEYMKRNHLSNDELDGMYMKKFSKTRSELNRNFLEGLPIKNILEVGCNIGNQLALLQSQGYRNLYGIEVFDQAVEISKQRTSGINIIQGSAFDIPFKDRYFDLVFTSGVLIHISPQDILTAIHEIYRVSRTYIWGYEYFDDTHHPLAYRENTDRLWCGNFANMYLDTFPDLTLVKEQRLPFKEIGLKLDEKGKSIDQDLCATMFLLKKV